MWSKYCISNNGSHMFSQEFIIPIFNLFVTFRFVELNFFGFCTAIIYRISLNDFFPWILCSLIFSNLNLKIVQKITKNTKIFLILWSEIHRNRKVLEEILWIEYVNTFFDIFLLVIRIKDYLSIRSLQKELNVKSIFIHQ